MDYGSAGAPTTERDSKWVPVLPDHVLHFVPYMAEFVGTFLLTFTTGSCVLWGIEDWNYTALGFMQMTLMYIFAPVSGGNFNPAITLSMGFCGKLKWDVVRSFILVQVVASCFAAGIISLMFEPVVVTPNTDVFTWYDAFFCEAVYTFELCTVYLNVWASRRNNPKDDQNQFFAFAVGLVYVAAGYAVGDISGAALNPAIALGFDTVNFRAAFWWGPLYSIFEITGAVLAAMFFYGIRSEEFDDTLLADQLSQFRPSVTVKAMAEFTGTFVFTLTFVLALVMNESCVWWAAAGAFASMFYAFSDICTGFFNPAAMIAVLLCARSKLPVLDACVYFVAQLMASTLAGLVTAYFHAVGPFSDISFGLGPLGTYHWSGVIICEMIFTMLLSYVVLAVCTTKPSCYTVTKQNFMFAFAVASVICGGGFSVGVISQGCFNPVVAFTITIESLVSHNQQTPAEWWGKFIWYWLAECLAAALASVVFFVSHPKELESNFGPSATSTLPLSSNA